MKIRLILIMVPILIGLLLCCSEVKALVEYVGLTCYVKDSLTLEPLANAYVVLIDQNYRISIFRTDDDGKVYISLEPGRYILIFLHDLPDTPGMDYVPARFDVEVKVEDVGKKWNAEVLLLPGATVILRGNIEYIGGSYGGYYMVKVLEPLTMSPPSPPGGNATPILTYGSTRLESVLLRRALPKVFKTIDMVVVPAKTDVVLLFHAYVYDERTEYLYRILKFTLDTQGKPINLNQGAMIKLDYTKQAITQVLDVVLSDVDYVRDLLVRAENEGFYVAAEREDLLRAESLIRLAQGKIEEGDYESAVSLLSEAYIMTRHALVRRLNYMYAVAMASAYILPAFLSFFAITMAFFLFEEDRRKALTFLIAYIISIVAFYYVYPGFRLIINLGKFLDFGMVTTASLLLFLALVFVLPRVFKEPTLPGEVSRMAVLTITFSVAKRYAKRRRLRCIITVFTIALLIWAFTVLTSISTVYGLTVTKLPTPAREVRVLVMRNLVENTPYPLPYYDIPWLTRFLNLTFLAPIAYNYPSATPVLAANLRGRSLEFMGVIAIKPSCEAKLIGLNELVVEGRYPIDEDKHFIMISRSFAEEHGVRLGDVLELWLQRGTIRVASLGKVKVVAILDDGALDNLKDLDGVPYLPMKLIGGKVEPCDPSEVVIINIDLLLERILPVLERGGALPTLAEIISLYRIAFGIEGDLDTYRDVARSIVYLKGYSVSIIYDGVAEKLCLGSKVEIRGYVPMMVPLAIVILNIALTMYSAVRERQRDVLIFTAVGFNPAHIALLFLAESIVLGLVGGGLGYLSGLATYKVLSLLAPGQQIVVREKLEWYWSVIGILIALGVSIASSVRAAFRAMYLAIPSLKRRRKAVKVEEVKEVAEIKEKIMRAHGEKTYELPVRIHYTEMPFFEGYVHDRLLMFSTGTVERIEDFKEEPLQTVEGKEVKRYEFTYLYRRAGKVEKAKVVLTAERKPEAEFFIIRLRARPLTVDTSVLTLDRVAEIAKDVAMDWLRERDRIMGK